MKVTVERAALLRALGHVHRVVERRRNTIPILSNVLLRAETGGLKLKATDLDMEVTESIRADVSQPGATTVPAHVIYDIIRKLPDGAQVSLETTGEAGQMQLRSGRSRFMLQTLSEADFPDLAAGEMTVAFPLAGADLKRLIEKTQFAISTEETRYYLNGIYLHTIEVEGEMKLRAVATDGHRLARIELPAPEGSVGMPGVIVPRKAVAEIQKLIDDAGGDVRLELSTAKVRLTFGGAASDDDGPVSGVVLTSKLIDGTFPDYQRVIPSGNDKFLTVERADFAKAVDRVSTISSERGRAVKLALSDGKLTLSVNNPDSGNAVEELDVDYDAAPLDVGFNARYLLDITSQLDGDTALFKLADPGSPTVIQDRDSAPALYVLMPMRVDALLGQTGARITRLLLQDFRSYPALDLPVSRGLVVLAGENGAGKTNLIEALSLFTPGRGLRRAEHGEMVRHGASGFAASIALGDEEDEHRLGTGLQPAPGGRPMRACRVDGAPVGSATAFAEYLRVIWLTPDLDGLFRGSPGDRRRFLDRLVLAVDAQHGARVNALDKALRSRNRLLEERSGEGAWLDAVERELAELGIAVAAARSETVARLDAEILAASDDASPFPFARLALAGELETLLASRPALEVEDRYRAALRDNRARDAAAGRTLFGPQAADLLVRHGPKDLPAETCSTGEQKALLVGLVLAHARLVRSMSGLPPTILLDEIAAHLDPLRRAALYDRLEGLGGQVWMTGADPALFAELEERADFFLVTPGRVTPARP